MNNPMTYIQNGDYLIPDLPQHLLVDLTDRCSQRPDGGRGVEIKDRHEVGGADEHLQSSGRGNPDGGAYSQLVV